MKRLILLADDSPTIQRLVLQMFAGGEFDVVSVSNGDAAVRKFEEIRPHLVLADVYMPGKNGYEVCAAVKQHPELGDTPVILLAGAFDAFDEGTANQVGAAAHITKPFEPQVLLNLVASLAKENAPRTVSEPPALVLRMESDSVREPAADSAMNEAAPALLPTSAAVKLSLEAPSVPMPAAAISEEEKPIPVEREEASVPAPAPSTTAAPVLEEPPRPQAAEVIKPSAVESPGVPSDGSDLLGLQDLFKPQSPANVTVSDAEIERIAQLVIQKLSTQVIENVAWDVVPDITTKVLKEELKRRP